MNKRITYVDYLRVFAAFAVVVLHVSSQKWHDTDVTTGTWAVFNFFDAISRWCVPVFVMITGKLVLGRKKSVGYLYSKYVMRAGFAFLFWWVIYALFASGSVMERLMSIKDQHHVWFIPMIIGLYMVTPFLDRIVEDRKLTRYFLILSFVFGFVLPELYTIGSDFGGPKVVSLVNAAYVFISMVEVRLVLGYSFFYVLGYYLEEVDLEKHSNWIYVVGALSFFTTVALTLEASRKSLMPSGNYYNNFTVNVMFEALAVYVWFKNREFKENAVVTSLSKLTLGVYLLHPIILQQLDVRMGVNTLSWQPAVSVMVLSLGICAVAFVIVKVMSLVPVLKDFV